MAGETNFTEDDLKALELAIATGVRECYYGDKRVVYRSLPEMNQAVIKIKKDLGLLTGKSRKYATFSKGLDC